MGEPMTGTTRAALRLALGLLRSGAELHRAVDALYLGGLVEIEAAVSMARAFGPSWSGRPCPSGGDPYDGRCESCAGYMQRAVVWLLAEEAYQRAERGRR